MKCEIILEGMCLIIFSLKRKVNRVAKMPFNLYILSCHIPSTHGSSALRCVFIVITLARSIKVSTKKTQSNTENTCVNGMLSSPNSIYHGKGQLFFCTKCILAKFLLVLDFWSLFFYLSICLFLLSE